MSEKIRRIIKDIQCWNCKKTMPKSLEITEGTEPDEVVFSCLFCQEKISTSVEGQLVPDTDVLCGKKAE